MSTDQINLGGSWYYDPLDARVAGRRSFDPVFRFDYLGFRLVLNINHEGEQHEKQG